MSASGSLVVPDKLTTYEATLDSEKNTLRNFGKNNSSIVGQIRNERISFGLYKDVLDREVKGSLAI
jgi:hypothetical protein